MLGAQLECGCGLTLCGVPGKGAALCGLEDSWPGLVLEAGDLVEQGTVGLGLSPAWLRARLPVHLTGN